MKPNREQGGQGAKDLVGIDLGFYSGGNEKPWECSGTGVTRSDFNHCRGQGWRLRDQLGGPALEVELMRTSQIWDN